MTQIHRLTVLLFALFMMLGCQNESDHKLIEELRQREIQAAESGDIGALLELRTDDFVAMPPDHPPVRGREEVRAFLESMFDVTSIRETVTSDEIVVEGDIAVDRGVFTGTATMNETGVEVPLDGKYLWVAVRDINGTWKYSAQMWSNNQRPES